MDGRVFLPRIRPERPCVLFFYFGPMNLFGIMYCYHAIEPIFISFAFKAVASPPVRLFDIWFGGVSVCLIVLCAALLNFVDFMQITQTSHICKEIIFRIPNIRNTRWLLLRFCGVLHIFLDHSKYIASITYSLVFWCKKEHQNTREYVIRPWWSQINCPTENHDY